MKSPSMPFYGRDFYGSTFVRMLPLPARAVYLELLWWQWQDGSIPPDPKELRKLMAVTPSAWRAIWPRLEPRFPLCDDGERRNPRMSEIIGNSRAHQNRGNSHLDPRTKILRRTRYEQLLRDPRWQRKRLEVLEERGFKCEQCHAVEHELHIHHVAYEPGKKPWEYDSKALAVLCAPCHRAKHGMVPR